MSSVIAAYDTIDNANEVDLNKSLGSMCQVIPSRLLEFKDPTLAYLANDVHVLLSSWPNVQPG